MFNPFGKKNTNKGTEDNNSNTEGSIVITFPKIIIPFTQETLIKLFLIAIFSVGGINYFKPAIEQFSPNINTQTNSSQTLNKGGNGDK